jgi:hypothetical protein
MHLHKQHQVVIKKGLQEQTGFQEVIFYQKIIEDIKTAFEIPKAPKAAA